MTIRSDRPAHLDDSVKIVRQALQHIERSRERLARAETVLGQSLSRVLRAETAAAVPDARDTSEE